MTTSASEKTRYDLLDSAEVCLKEGMPDSAAVALVQYIAETDRPLGHVVRDYARRIIEAYKRKAL